MKTNSLRQGFWKLLAGVVGGSTSLVEASAVIGIGSVLAGAAAVAGINSVDMAKVQASKEDVGAIGQAILSFYQDNKVYPMFKDGNHVGANDGQFKFLASTNGAFPVDSSHSVTTGVNSWRIPATTAHTVAGFFGEKLDYDTYDSLENQLNLNTPGKKPGDGPTGVGYPLLGAFSGDDQRGWNGAYAKGIPATDPWGNKYIVNVQELSAQHLLNDHTSSSSSSALPKRAVFVISAGPNRALETSSEQDLAGADAVVTGDDIAYRIR